MRLVRYHQGMQITKRMRKVTASDFEERIYFSLRENFDAAVRVLRKSTGIFFPDEMAMKMLKFYSATFGWLYPWDTPGNVPWMLLYLYSPPVPLAGLPIKAGSPVHGELEKTGICLESAADVPTEGEYLAADDPDFYFCTENHNRRVRRGELKETVSLVLQKIDPCGDFGGRTVFSLPVRIGHNDYYYASQVTERDSHLLCMAADILPETIPKPGEDADPYDIVFVDDATP